MRFDRRGRRRGANRMPAVLRHRRLHRLADFAHPLRLWFRLIYVLRGLRAGDLPDHLNLLPGLFLR